MTATSSHEITRLLIAWSDGDQTAMDKLVPLVYGELRRLARRYMHREAPGHLLQTTALVNEAYIRLIDANQVRWQNRAHFFAISARVMRRILVDFARRSRQLKRGGKVNKVSLAETVVASEGQAADLLAVDDALTALTALDPRQSQVVELRFFGGLKDNEIAEVLKVSHGTVRRDWRLARAWLHRELSKD